MSADLLRRAAAMLREKATAATDGSWCSLDGGDRLVSFSGDGHTQFGYVVDEPMTNAANAAYIALVHPPVALALANLLQLQSAFDSPEKSPDAPAYAVAVHVARAVLREPEGGDRNA